MSNATAINYDYLSREEEREGPIDEATLSNHVEVLKDLAQALIREIDRLRHTQLPDVARGVNFYEEVERFEINLIRSALERTSGHQTRAARMLGINVTTTKLSAFALGAMFGGFAGAFFATRQAFVSPESFTFIESAIILAIVVLGGLGSQVGVAIAALVMIGGFELFRGLDEWRMLVFGAAMVVIMVLRPRGLVGTRTPTVALGQKRAISGDLVSEGHG